MGIWEGLRNETEPGFSCRGVNLAYECSEQAERPVSVRHERD